MSCEIDWDGCKFWYNERGQLHRECGPVIEYDNGDKYWYFKDKLHREDGPAVEYVYGTKRWYYNGILYSKQEFRRKFLRKWRKI